jgi:hypothetical protein
MATGPDEVRFQGKNGSSRLTTKMTRLTRLRLWPQEEPTVTSTDGRHLAAFFLP